MADVSLPHGLGTLDTIPSPIYPLSIRPQFLPAGSTQTKRMDIFKQLERLI